MANIIYMNEQNVRDLIESEVQTNLDRGYIKSSEGFARHLVDTGNIAYEVALGIQANNPRLSGQINPEILRLAGWMHDFSKVSEGNEYHDVGTPYLILTEGDGRLELVKGGSQAERKGILKKMASLIPPDFALYEELGGADFPKRVAYPERIAEFKERIDFLRRKLSKDENVLTMEEFALPLTLNQQIALYADMVNVNGERVNARDRLEEIKVRYGDSQGAYYNPKMVELTERITPRILVVCSTIESLLA